MTKKTEQEYLARIAELEKQVSLLSEKALTIDIDTELDKKFYTDLIKAFENIQEEQGGYIWLKLNNK